MGKQKLKNRFLIDFMTITFRQSCNMTPEQVLDYFCSFFSHPEVQPVNFLKLDKGLPGYNKSYRFMGQNIISISWHDSYPAHGIMLNLTGQGCSFFKRDELVKFYESCKADQLNFKVTRIDIAYDDFHGFIPVDQMVQSMDTHLNEHRVIATRIHPNNMENIGFYYEGQSGINLNFGTKGSNFFVRLYDKRREQKAKELDYWKRFEVQLRHEEAFAFMETLSEGEKIQTAFVALLDRKIRFTDGRYLDRPDNCPTADWWADFLKILTAARFQNIRTAIDRLKYTFKELLKQKTDRKINPQHAPVDALVNTFYYIEDQLGVYISFLRDFFPDSIDCIANRNRYKQYTKPKYNIIRLACEEKFGKRAIPAL